MSFAAVTPGTGRVCAFRIPPVHGKIGITSQWVGFVVTSPQTSQLNSGSVVIAQFLIYHWLVTPTRDRGLSEVWCQNRELTDLFPLRGTMQVGGMVHHPDLRNLLAKHASTDRHLGIL